MVYFNFIKIFPSFPGSVSPELSKLTRCTIVNTLLFILISICAKCFIIFCRHFICMQIVKPWLFIARCICKQIRHIFRGRSYRWQSNQSKTRKYIFYFFLPWLGIEPRTFKFGIYCLARQCYQIQANCKLKIFRWNIELILSNQVVKMMLFTPRIN